MPRHVVPAQIFAQPHRVFDAHRLAQRLRHEEIFQRMPDRRRGFVGIAKGRLGGTFAPTGETVGFDAHEDAVPIGLDAERGFKRRDQRHADVIEGDAIDGHDVL